MKRSSIFRRAERGIALLIVVSLLTVIGIMGVAFAFSMFLETQESRQFVSTARARYLAEAGVNHARALLDEDRLGSRVDDRTEAWTQALAGSDADVDQDSAVDARWWTVADVAAQPAGRYAIQITDEAGKANLNAAMADPSQSPVGAINLTTLLQEAGLSQTRAQQAALVIERYRYGEDGRPGTAGVDDDRDGAIDEPDEYQPTALQGDDRRLEGLEEIAPSAGLSAEEMHRLSQLATVYSWDINMSVTGQPRLNVNTATANELLGMLLEQSVGDPWQAAANIADYVDDDVEMSRVNKSSQALWIPNQGTIGDWEWSADPEGHYVSTTAEGSALSWSVSVPTGTFRILARGLEGMKVGDITLAGQLRRSVSDGESLGVFELQEALSVSVVNREPSGTRCAFRGLELVSEGAAGGVAVRGIEAIRFSELMVEPTMSFEVGSATSIPLGWSCTGTPLLCARSQVGQSVWVWDPKAGSPPKTMPWLPGRYYVRVFAAAPGQRVGEVRVEGQTQLLVHGQRHSATLLVGSDGKISLTIGKTNPDETYYLKSISLSLEPDGEYAEFINLSDRDMDMSGWTIEGELAGGRQARLPSGSVIKAHGLLLAVVDLDDTQSTLAGNGIDARSAWDLGQGVNVVQLEFPSGAPSPDDDWLKTTLPKGSPSRLLLRSGSSTVDEVQYHLPLSTTAEFQSLEKGDPTVVSDQDLDGVDEGWFPSLRLFTPGLPNDNDGLKEVVELKTIVHDPSKEITILNRPLGGVGELAGVPSGKAWKPFASADLAKIVDRFTVEGYRLEAEGHFHGTQGQDAWEEKADGYYVHTDPSKAQLSGQWQWTTVPEGRYRLSLYGWPQEQCSTRWQRRDGTFTDWSPALSADAQGRIVVGQLAVGMGETPATALTLDVQCASLDGICHFDYARLDPQLLRIGPVNVNTAPLGVLLALPGMTDALASRLMTGRPYGDRDEKGRGIGDLLLGDTLGADEAAKLAVFRKLAHLLTTRSDVFQILSLGQAMNNDRVEATQRVQTIVQR